MAATPAKQNKDTVPNQATPQKKDESMIPSPYKPLAKSPAQHTPGQTPIKSPALKKGKVGATEPAITEDVQLQPQGSPADTEPTLSQKWENPQYWFPDRQPEATGNTPPPTQKDPETPEEEVPSIVEIPPAMKVELDELEASYNKRVGSVIDIKHRKGLDLKDPVKVRALDLWANKSIEDLKTDFEASKAEIIKKFQGPEVQPFDEKDFISSLTAELESLSLGQDTPKSTNTPNPDQAYWFLIWGSIIANRISTHTPQFFQICTPEGHVDVNIHWHLRFEPVIHCWNWGLIRFDMAGWFWECGSCV